MYSESGIPLTDNVITEIINTLPSRALSHPAMPSLGRSASRGQFEPVSRSFAARVLEHSL